MPNRIQNRCINQFLPGLDGAQHKPAPAHIASPNELDGKQQAVVKNLKQRVYVLCGGNAPEEYDVA
jgi:hypothetical protein